MPIIDERTVSATERESYEVGYGKPPQRTQFKKGQSGNPSGRQRGVRNLTTDVRRTLKVPVRVNTSGGARNVSTQEGALLLLRERALKGDVRALDRLLELARLFNNDPADPGRSQPPSDDDQAILNAYSAEIRAGPGVPVARDEGNEQPAPEPEAKK
jgi:Family of unknown function (DUF5681)